MSIDQWWTGISEALRNHLREQGDGELTAEQVREITGAGGTVSSEAYWLETGSGPQGFYLTHAEVMYAAEH